MEVRDSLVDHARISFLRAVKPTLQLVSMINWPVRHLINNDDYLAAKAVLMPGMGLVTRTRGCLTNLIILGYWKHAAIYVGEIDGIDYVVEAVGTGVVKTPLDQFMLNKDDYAAMRPLFADQSLMDRAAVICLQQIGSSYDYLFEYNLGDNSEFYCQELVWYGYEKALNEVERSSPFTPREVFGIKYMSPQDMYNARSKWEIVIEKE